MLVPLPYIWYTNPSLLKKVKTARNISEVILAASKDRRDICVAVELFGQRSLFNLPKTGDCWFKVTADYVAVMEWQSLAHGQSHRGCQPDTAFGREGQRWSR